MKRMLACVLTLLLLLPIAGVFSASAADDGLRVIKNKVIDDNPNDDHYYFEFKFDEPMRPARYFQDYNRRGEPGQAEAYLFGDDLTDAVRKYVLINGTNVNDYIDVFQNVDYFSFFYDSDEENGAMLIKIFHQYMSGFSLDDKITIEVKAGMIDVDGNPIVPFTAVYDPAVSRTELKVTLHPINTTTKPVSTGRPGTTSNPTSNPTSNTAGPGVTTKPPVTQDGTTSTGVSEVTTGDSNTQNTTDTGFDTQPDDPTESMTGTEPTQAVQASAALSSKNSGIVIDTDKSTVKLSKSLKVSALLAELESGSGYAIGVYNGPNPVAENEPVYTGYRLKVRSGDKLIANYEIIAPEPSNTGLVIVIVCVAAVLLAAAGVLLYFLVLRKRKAILAEKGDEESK